MSEASAPRRRRRLALSIVLVVAIVFIGALWHQTHPGHHYECTGNVITGQKCLVGP